MFRELNSTKVTISDCGNAIEAIENELAKLEFDRRELERKISMLRTHAVMIRQLVVML